MLENAATLTQKERHLISLLQGKKILLAFSGGLDSSVLLLYGMKYASSLIPVFFSGPIFGVHELNSARILCSLLKIQLEVIDVNPLEDPDFKKNPPDRCYYCKRKIMENLLNIKSELSYDLVIEGTNISELQGLRPGYEAIKELHILSPYVESDITKPDIRMLLEQIISNIADFLGKDFQNPAIIDALEKVKDKPPSPCLCSRIEYNLPIDAQVLHKVELAEEFLKNMFNVTNVRVRVHQNNLVRIEVDRHFIDDLMKKEKSDKILAYLKSLGFKYITMDIEGFRSGSLNL